MIEAVQEGQRRRELGFKAEQRTGSSALPELRNDKTVCTRKLGSSATPAAHLVRFDFSIRQWNGSAARSRLKAPATNV